MLKKNLLLVVAVFLLKCISAQQADTSAKEYDVYELPSISLGGTMQSFYGDLGEKGYKIFLNTNLRKGRIITVEQRKSPSLGYAVSAIYGIMSESEVREDRRNLNFYTELYTADFKFVYHLDNGKILDKNARFAPYLIAGLGFMYFDPYGDLYLGNNLKYHYWKDGTIRNVPETTAPNQQSIIIERDYRYETKLDADREHANVALYLPLGGGFKYKLSDMFELNWSLIYNMTTSDYIDNYSGKGKSIPFFSWKNDGFLQAQFTLQYNLSGKIPFNRYRHVNFRHIEKEDMDNDGVRDFDDDCPETPEGVKVDKKGCPFDTDDDGVPDYMDKELKSAANAVVDEFGVTYTDSVYQALYERDSLLTSGEWYNLKRMEMIKEKTFSKISVLQEGTFYRIYMLATKEEVHPWYFAQNYNYEGTVYVEEKDGRYIYYIGNFISYEDAKYMNKTIQKLYKIFSKVTAFKDGQEISIEEALKQEQK